MGGEHSVDGDITLNDAATSDTGDEVRRSTLCSGLPQPISELFPMRCYLDI